MLRTGCCFCMQMDYADVTNLLQQVQDELQQVQQQPAVEDPATGARLRELEGQLQNTTTNLAAVQVA